MGDGRGEGGTGGMIRWVMNGSRCHGIEESCMSFIPLQRFAFLFFAPTHPPTYARAPNS